MALAPTFKVPGNYAEVDNSQALQGAQAGQFKSVLIGQKTSGGTVTANQFTQVFSAPAGQLLAGAGSVLDEMIQAWFQNNPTTPVYMVALDDDGGATAATKTLTVTGPATANGTVYLYINGKLTRIGVTSGDSADDVAAAINAAINADVSLPYTSGVASDVVTLTAKNGGTLGNAIDVRINLNTGEELPAGIGIATAAGATGATDPDITDAINAVPDDVVNLWVNSLTDSTSLAALVTELDDRWSETKQIDGHAIQVAPQDTVANTVTFGNALNSEHLTVFDGGTDAPTPPYILAAMIGGQHALSASVDPARPFTTLEIDGAIGDTLTNKRSITDRDSLLNAGIATTKIDDNGTVRIERSITTYKTNGAGAIDLSYLNTNTMLQLSYYRLSYINWMQSRFPRHKLADNGFQGGAGQPIVTPNYIKAAAIAHFDELSRLGITDSSGRDDFIDNSVFVRDLSNRSLVNAVVAPKLIGQYYQLFTEIQFRL
jgi:phage tail sheath gpL-like